MFSPPCCIVRWSNLEPVTWSPPHLYPDYTGQVNRTQTGFLAIGIRPNTTFKIVFTVISLSSATPSPPHSLFFCVYLPSFRFLSSSVSDKSHTHTAAASFQKLLSVHWTRHKLVILVVTLRRRSPLSSGTRVLGYLTERGGFSCLLQIVLTIKLNEHVVICVCQGKGHVSVLLFNQMGFCNLNPSQPIVTWAHPSVSFNTLVLSTVLV